MAPRHETDLRLKARKILQLAAATALGLLAGMWVAQSCAPAIVDAAPFVPNLCVLDLAVAERRLDACMDANNQYLELSAKEIAKVAKACERSSKALGRFLNVDSYSGFDPNHPACAELRAAHIVVPKECRDWEGRRIRLVPPPD